jgi:O-methyltransferase domain
LGNDFCSTDAARDLLLADLAMLVRTGGRERTEDEYRPLLVAAGFTLAVIVPTDTGYSVLKAVRE